MAVEVLAGCAQCHFWLDAMPAALMPIHRGPRDFFTVQPGVLGVAGQESVQQSVSPRVGGAAGRCHCRPRRDLA